MLKRLAGEKLQLMSICLTLEDLDVLVTRSLGIKILTVFVASLFSLTLNYPAHFCQTSVPVIFLYIILKILQFLTLVWQQGI